MIGINSTPIPFTELTIRTGGISNSLGILGGKFTAAIDPLGVVTIGILTPSSTPSKVTVSLGSYPIPGFDTYISVISPVILVEIPTSEPPEPPRQ